MLTRLGLVGSILLTAAGILTAGSPTSINLLHNHSNTVYGETLIFTAQVTSTDPGTPTGTVTFYFDGTPQAPVALVGGSASITTNTLPAGLHNIGAGYSGDATFDAQFTTNFSQTVVQASATTTLISSTNPSSFGAPVTVTATVLAVAPGAGVRTGTVTFLDGATMLGVTSLNVSGQAALTTSSLSLGSHNLTAVYSGDTNFAGSTSSPLTQVVNSTSTTTSLIPTPNPSVVGQPVLLTATVTSPAPGTITGTVTFLDGATTLGTGTLSGASASVSAAFTSAGAHSLTARYNGDSTYLTSTSSAVSQTVNAGATSTALISSVNPSNVGQSVTFTATVNVTAPAAGTPTGTVTFRDGATTLGTASLNASRVATFSTSSLATGARSITATYSADANFAGSIGSLTQSVGKLNTTTAISIPNGSASAGAPVFFTATVTSSSGVPTGTVTFTDGSNVLGAYPLNASGVATSTGIALAAGQHSVVATYNGDANYNTSSSPTAPNLTVNLTQTSISAPVIRSGNPNAGEAVTLASTVSGDRRTTGMVTFRDNGVVIGTAPIDQAGTAVITTRLATGSHSIVASYEGDVQNNGSTSEPLFLIVRGSVTVTLTSSANPSASGAAVTFTAAIAAATTGGPVATGTVSFTDGTRALGNSTVTDGKATFAATGLTAGDHTIVAAYSGDTNYPAANSAALTQKVDRAATTTALDAAADANGYLLVATVRGVTAGSVPTGAVTFEDATTNATLGSGMIADGSASVRLAMPLPVGHRLRAVYVGDTSYAGSSSGMMPFIAGANAFSFALTFARDSIVSLFGADLADSTVAAPSLPLPTTLGGVTVKFVDAAGTSHNASIYFVSAGQINIVVPGDVPVGSARLMVTNSRGSYSISIVVARTSPSLASGDGSGAGPAAAHLLRVHADGSQDPLMVVSGSSVPFGAATDSLYLILYGTGLRNGQGSTSCSLNGQSVNALYSGAHATYPGLDQVNLEVPGSLRGAGRVTVNCTVGGQTTNSVTINVQ